MREPLFGQAPLEEGTRVHARRRMRLEVDQIAGVSAAEEMVEADFEQVCGGGVARDMAAELGMRAIRAHHHRQRVPAHDRRNAALQFQVAGKLRLLGERDGVLVGRVEYRRQRHAARARMVHELAQEERRALASLGCNKGVKGVEPFPGLQRVRVRRVHAPEGGSDDVGEVGHGEMLCPPDFCSPTGPSTPRERVLYLAPQ